ncbi:MAG TPA: hypothetical protein VGL51_09680 [Solirubrobacteraceae bacterium]|jgi:hypothetical protein
MKTKKCPRQAICQVDLLDAQMETYVTWVAESRSVAQSYHDFRCAPGVERAAAYFRYLAALDREERAAGDHRRALERIRAT